MQKARPVDSPGVGAAVHEDSLRGTGEIVAIGESARGGEQILESSPSADSGVATILHFLEVSARFAVCFTAWEIEYVLVPLF